METAEEPRFMNERYTSMVANAAPASSCLQYPRRLQMQDADKEAQKLKRSNSFYGVFGLSK